MKARNENDMYDIKEKAFSIHAINNTYNIK